MKKEYNIKLPDGAIVPVTEEVYRAYKRPQWREAKKKKLKREISLENFNDVHTLSDEKLVEQIVEDKLLLEMLLKALETLTEDERFLIDEIYFQEKTEREISKESRIPQQTINSRKKKIIEKLKKYLK